MLSLHPQDITYRTHGAHSILPAPDRPSFRSPFTMGNSGNTSSAASHQQIPPSPPRAPADADDDYFCTSSSQQQYQQQQHQQETSQSSSAATTATTINPPADYNHLDANTVAAALEIARDSPDGARADPIVSGILETALSQLWARVTAEGNDGGEAGGYVMTPGEFAVFNFYQHRFLGNKIAVAARARYWDNMHA